MSKCIFCGGSKINDSQGIVIKDKYICFYCEEQINKIQVDDEKYDFYINGLKKIWRCLGL